VSTHHRSGLLITDDNGHITQTIRFPQHNQARPFLAWQPTMTVTAPTIPAVTSRYRVLSASAVPGLRPGARKYVGSGTQGVDLVVSHSGLLYWTNTGHSFQLLAPPRDAWVDARGRRGHVRVPQGSYVVRVIAPGGKWTLITPVTLEHRADLGQVTGRVAGRNLHVFHMRV